MIPSTKAICLILLTVLSIVLIGVVIGCVIRIIQLNNKYTYLAKNQGNNCMSNNTVTEELLLSIKNSLHGVEDSLHNKTTVNFAELFEKLKISIDDLSGDLSKGK